MKKIIIASFLILGSFASLADTALTGTIESLEEMPVFKMYGKPERNINQAQTDAEDAEKAWENAFMSSTVLHLTDYDFKWEIKVSPIYRTIRRCGDIMGLPNCSERQVFEHNEYYPEIKISLINTDYYMAKIVYSAEKFNCLQLRSLLVKDIRFAGIPFANIENCEAKRGKAVWKNITVTMNRETKI